MVDLVDGVASVNIDTVSRMTEGTFAALANVHSWTSTNETGWEPVRCNVVGNIVNIECRDTTSTDKVYWEVRGIRKDEAMQCCDSCDSDGRLIVEPERIVEPPRQNPEWSGQPAPDDEIEETCHDH